MPAHFKRYAVIGNPIAHSQSPFIHTAFAQQTGKAIHYKAILAEVDQFKQTVQAFQKNGGSGLNITVPFKQEAWHFIDQCTDRAELARAVNTIWFDKGQYIGDNTDGIGLVRDLTDNLGFPLQGKKLLILGAGGAVRGVLAPLLAMHPTHCVIANRTVSKAQALVDIFKAYGEITACSYQSLVDQSFDLIINGTSASLQGELPPLPNGILVQGGSCYDIAYGRGLTPFLQWALSQYAQQVVDGLGMLVEQAAEAFFLWHQVRPDTETVICQLKAHLQRF